MPLSEMKPAPVMADPKITGSRIRVRIQHRKRAFKMVKQRQEKSDADKHKKNEMSI